MNHDIQASWAAGEVARYFQANPNACLATLPTSSLFDVFASREGKSYWPFPDGVINVETGTASYRLALEFKRPNEGIHGMLTALGQSQAYLYKGYNGTVIVVPQKYDVRGDYGGSYLDQVLQYTGSDLPISVFGYEAPDPGKLSPFEDKLSHLRGLQADRPVSLGAPTATPNRTETQWAHTREGSSTPSAFFRYLQIAKGISESSTELEVILPSPLEAAVGRIDSAANPIKYLSYTSGHTFHDIVWRQFWFEWVFHKDNRQIWLPGTSYDVNDRPTNLQQWDGSAPSKFWSGKTNSIRNRLVARLNSGEIDEGVAWEEWARNVHNRAHQLREDVDSGLEHMGFIDSDGRPTELGYRFASAAERASDNPHRGVPRAILSAALIQNGQFGALLHYVHKLSEETFQDDPLAFTSEDARGALVFNSDEYRAWIEQQLAENLRVMSKSAVRGGVARKPLQAELMLLGGLGFIPPGRSRKRYRLGVGLVINWSAVQEAMDATL